MTARRRKGAGTKRRRWPLAVAAVCAALVTGIALTKPQQLPGLIGDQPAVRVVYGWKDGAAAWLHRQIYPLSALRDDAPPGGKTGTGYSNRDRHALDDLIDQKTETKD